MKRIQSIALICAILSMFLCVSCDLDFAVKGSAAAFFNASVSKSLNESASTESTTEDVNQYYWLYYAGLEAPGDSAQFLPFKDLLDTNGNNSQYNKGLGSISDLMRGESYYFALKGYSFAYINNSGAGITVQANDEDLKWYGTSKQYRVTGSKMNINLAVAPAGQGSLKFDFKAPLVTTDSNWFEISITPIDNSQNTQTIHGQGTVSGFVVSYTTDEEHLIALDCGCYFITVQQQERSLDPQSSEEIFTDIENRGQLVIAQIESGVTTLISGTLDSSTTREAAK